MKNFIVCLGLLVLAPFALARPAQAVVQKSELRRLRTSISFDETYERYPSPYDVFYHMERLLPFLDRQRQSAECYRLGEENTTVLGGNLPSFGAPLENEPGALFTELYAKCFNQAFDLGLKSYDDSAKKNLDAILGESLSESVAEVAIKGYPKPWTRGLWSQVAVVSWTSLDAELRRKVLARLVEYIVGPDSLLAEKELIGEDSVFGAEVRTKDDLLKTMERKSLEKTPGTVLDVIRGSALLLRLGPTVLRQ